MAVKNVDLTVSQLVNDLNSGLTWLKKDDLGYGSIEVKYGASPMQIAAIRKHPALKDAETSITIFNIIDDTKNENTNTKGSTAQGTTAESGQHMVPVDSKRTEVVSSSTPADAADVFASL